MSDRFLSRMSLIGSLKRKLQKIQYFTFSCYLRPFDNISVMLIPPFHYLKGEMQLAYKKNLLDFEKRGGPGMCFTEHTKF